MNSSKYRPSRLGCLSMQATPDPPALCTYLIQRVFCRKNRLHSQPTSSTFLLRQQIKGFCSVALANNSEIQYKADPDLQWLDPLEGWWSVTSESRKDKEWGFTLSRHCSRRMGRRLSARVKIWLPGMSMHYECITVVLLRVGERGLVAEGEAVASRTRDFQT
jgi:hypothetical protein